MHWRPLIIFLAYLLIGAKEDVGRESRRARRAGSSFSHRESSVRIGVPGLKVRKVSDLSSFLLWLIELLPSICEIQKDQTIHAWYLVAIASG